jgi:hypothetical protein
MKFNRKLLEQEAEEMRAGERGFWSARACLMHASSPRRTLEIIMPITTARQRRQLESRGWLLDLVQREVERARDPLAERRPGEALARARAQLRKRHRFVRGAGLFASIEKARVRATAAVDLVAFDFERFAEACLAESPSCQGYTGGTRP